MLACYQLCTLKIKPKQSYPKCFLFYPTETMHQSKQWGYMVVKPQCMIVKLQYISIWMLHIQLKEVQSKQIEPYTAPQNYMLSEN